MILNDIIVPAEYRRKPPAQWKVNRIIGCFKSGLDIGREIYVDKAGVLRDGYIRYLVLILMGVMEAEISRNVRQCTTTYVYAYHRSSHRKMYVWRIGPETKDAGNLRQGGSILVPSQGQLLWVTISKIANETTDKRRRVKQIRLCTF